MKFRNQFLKYRLNQMSDGEGGGGEGGSGGGEDVAAVIADLQSQVKAMQAKNDELLGEVKSAKKARREAEEASNSAAEEALKKAGDFESLYNSEVEKHNETKSQFGGLKEKVANQARDTEALKIAAELADGPNVDLLSGFIATRLRYTDEGLKVTDANGNLTVSTSDDLKNEFANDTRYASLLKGNQSSGGGASGGKNGGGAATKQMPRSDFEKLNPAKQMEFMKSGGDLIE